MLVIFLKLGLFVGMNFMEFECVLSLCYYHGIELFFAIKHGMYRSCLQKLGTLIFEWFHKTFHIMGQGISSKILTCSTNYLSFVLL